MWKTIRYDTLLAPPQMVKLFASYKEVVESMCLCLLGSLSKVEEIILLMNLSDGRVT